MAFTEMLGHTVPFETFTNVDEMFCYTHFECPRGSPNILEPARAPQEVYYTYSTTCNKLLDSKGTFSDMGCKGSGPLLVFESLHTLHCLHG